MTPMMSIIRRRKLKWYGHIKRCSHPIRNIFEGMVNGKRNRGRPPRRWRADAREWTGLTWSELNKIVKDRNEWRTITNM